MQNILFAHNQTAYETVLSMLAESGKAAVIYPTGTGKSFIGFQLCTDHPESRVCWLSPSEYIFKTQVENWTKAGGKKLANITFITYAKLMLLDEAELSAIKPDYIILDEFHRCGAQQWGAGVEKLLALYPSVPLVGLSATNIRYLDSQRDMADELFDGNIAAQMSLGEAIVRGILNPPKYVLSVFPYELKLSKYAKRIRSAKSPAVRQAAEEQFEALRRALQQAQGMADIFDKHMTERTGKYLVFCSDLKHLDEMAAKVPEWFSKVDPEAHVYRAYADDPSVDREFAAFKDDESAHLKLLFCIDMLNEGVHVDDISGVILLRPTISPIIYKQQIGRALAAGKKKDAVIFDIVLNIENLYSISSIREEMRAAITYYRYLGEHRLIVNEAFEVVDETRDCRQLFTELEETLNASWDLMYAEAERYYREHGDLLIPTKYRTQAGFSLGAWLNTQRKIYSGKSVGHLTDVQIEKLDRIGIVWENYNDLTWEKSYLEAKAYFDCFGDLQVPARYVTESGFPLGVWICRMRAAQANGRAGILNEERVWKLDEIGMSWDVLSDQWEKNFEEAAAYFRDNGNLLVPRDYVTASGLKLGNWISHLRSARKGKSALRLTDEQIARLDRIGMAWDADAERWRIGYDAAVSYHNEYGNLNVPVKFTMPDGFDLGAWLTLKRRQYKKGVLKAEQIKALERLGMCWDLHEERWQAMYQAAADYASQFGDLRIPRGYLTPDGYDLSTWLIRMQRSREKLTLDQIHKLDALGIVWKKKKLAREDDSVFAQQAV